MSAGAVVAAVSAAIWRRDLKARPLLRIRYGGQWSEWEERPTFAKATARQA
jgi:hypothetical protein